MAIDGPRGPIDDPRERRPDGRPDPYPRTLVPHPGDRRVWPPDPDRRSDAERLADGLDEPDELDPPSRADERLAADRAMREQYREAGGRSDAERLAAAVDERDLPERDLPGPVDEQSARDRAQQERVRQQADRRLLADRNRLRAEDRREDERDRREDDRDRQRDEQDRQRDEQDRQRDEQDRQREDRERLREDDRSDPARDAAQVAGPAVAAAAVAESADPERAAEERGPNRLADRPSRIEAALDPDANRRWQEPGVVPTREELDQALDPEGRFTPERQEQARREQRERIERALNGEPDRDPHTADTDGQDAAGPAARPTAEAQGQPDRDRPGRDEDYVGRHRAEDGSEQDGRHRGGDDRRFEGQQFDGRQFDSGAPDRQHWAPPAADAQVRRGGPDQGRQGQQPDARRDRESSDRQRGAAQAQDPSRRQEHERGSQDGKKLAAGGMAAAGKAMGSADALIESASPTGRAAVSQRWEYGRGTRPGDRALNKAMSLLNSGQRSASQAAQPPARAPEAVPHSGAHTAGQFHQRYQNQPQQHRHREQGG